MYFSMHDERQVCSLEDREVDGLGMQIAKQFLKRSHVRQEYCDVIGSRNSEDSREQEMSLTKRRLPVKRPETTPRAHQP